MPWAKTDAGRLEIQSRSLVNSRPQRTLLLLIDGKKTDEQLLASVAGTSAADFALLRELGLVIAAGATADSPSGGPSLQAVSAALNDHAAARTPSPSPAPSLVPDIHIDIPVDVELASPSADHLSKTLTSLIASELGLRGFTLTLAVERASGIDALRDVANRVLQQIETRRGAPAADKARPRSFRTLTALARPGE